MAHQQRADGTFDSTVPTRDEFSAHAHAEFDALSRAVCEGLRDGNLPPDEAYWWTRILFSEAVVSLNNACHVHGASTEPCGAGCFCALADAA
jgi:hypothetical protein